MTTMQKETALSVEEENKVIDRYLELADAGRDDEAVALFDAHFSILPYLADTAKKIMGAKALRESGMNLTAAIEMFGDDWLNDDD